MKMDKDFALLYGIMLGDGCLSFVKPKYYFLSITGHAVDDRPFFNKIVKPLLDKYVERDVKIKERYKKNTIELQPACKEFFKELNKIGFPIGLKGPSLQIPKSLNKYMKEITQGYFATDGCLVLTNNHGILYPRIEFASISRRLLEQVREYLESIGMSAKIYISHKSKGNWQTLYRIQSNGLYNLEIFRYKVSFVNPKHEIKYKRYVKKRKNAGAGI